MKLPWIKPPTATVAELREQLEHAQSAHTDAEKAIAVAQSDFDAAVTPTTEKALRSARETAQASAEHLGRAQRLLAAAEEREATKQRQEFERQKADIEKSLAALRKRASDDLIDAEVEALGAVADVRVQRLELRDEIREVRRNLAIVRGKLGEPPQTSSFTDSDHPSWVDVDARLDRVIEKNRAGAREQLLQQLRPNGDSYFVSRHTAQAAE